MDADFGRLAFGEVKVGAFDVNEVLEVGVDACHSEGGGMSVTGWGRLGLKEGAHLHFVLGAVEAFLRGDEAFDVEGAEGFVHSNHADIFAGLHHAGEHVGFSFADAVGHGGGINEELEREHASTAIGAWDELLRKHAAKRFGYHDADLVALVGGENVEHAIKGSRCIAGVECAKDKVPGFCSGEGELNGFKVAHFSDHDDIGVFTEGTAESLGEGIGVGVDFALIDVATCGFEDVFDGVFEGEDVIFAVLVDEVHECGEGGGFS